MCITLSKLCAVDIFFPAVYHRLETAPSTFFETLSWHDQRHYRKTVESQKMASLPALLPALTTPPKYGSTMLPKLSKFGLGCCVHDELSKWLTCFLYVTEKDINRVFLAPAWPHTKTAKHKLIHNDYTVSYVNHLTSFRTTMPLDWLIESIRVSPVSYE